MKRNVIFWVGIKNNAHNDKYDNFEYFDYTKATWKHFCKRFNCEFVEFSEPIQKDLFEYRVNWQKSMYVFDILDEKGIKYDQIALVDSTCMYRWDAPNFFELTDHKFTAWRDIDNLNWIFQSIQGYKPFFNNFELDIKKYINSGFIIFNEKHKDFFNSFKNLYEQNKAFFIDAQDVSIRKGTEQTPLNYWLQMNNVEVKTDLPVAFKLTHLNRKELFGFNWQLNTDKTPFFIKYGYNWIFNGIPKDQRSQLLKLVWDFVEDKYTDDAYIQQLLETTPHKDIAKYATSKKFKQDIINYFKGSNKTYLELGSCQGNSLLVYSKVFNTVLGLDYSQSNIDISKNTCKYCDNVTIMNFDVTNSWDTLPTVDVVNLDALHTQEGIELMINKTKNKFPKAIMFIDDYGHEHGVVKIAIDNLINTNVIEVIQWIGEDKGYLAANGKQFVDKEGLIFKFN